MRSPALLSALLALLALPARAATCEQTLRDLSFGSYASGQAAPVDANSSIRIDCGNDGSAESIGYSIGLGRSGNGSLDPRALSAGAEELSYNLYLDPARSIVWGDGSGGLPATGQIDLPGSGSAEHIVYGRIPPLQSATPGFYGDTLTVTIDY